MTPSSRSYGAPRAVQEVEAEPQRRLHVLQAGWLDERGIRSRRRLWFTLLVMLLVVALEPSGYFIGEGNGRYLLVVFPLLVICVVRPGDSPLTIRTLTTPDKFLGLLLLYGVIGSLYGILFVHSDSPSLAVFLPMGVGLLHLTTLGGVADQEATKHLNWLLYISAAYVVAHTANALGFVPGRDPRGGPTSIPDSVFSHLKAFLIALALTAAWILGRRLLLAALALLATVVFFVYPAGTYVVVAFIVLITLVATGRRPGRVRAYSMAMLTLALVGAVYLQVVGAGSSQGTSLVGAYFEAVRKTDNTDTRGALWAEAISQIQRSPIVGSGFTGGISVPGRFSGEDARVPPHNDLLQIGMGGGLVAMALLVGWIVTTNVTVVRHYWRLVAEGRSPPARLLRLLLVGYNTFLAVAMLNPMLSLMGLNLALMALYSMAMSLLVVGTATTSGSEGADRRLYVARERVPLTGLVPSVPGDQAR